MVLAEQRLTLASQLVKALYVDKVARDVPVFNATFFRDSTSCHFLSFSDQVLVLDVVGFSQTIVLLSSLGSSKALVLEFMRVQSDRASYAWPNLPSSSKGSLLPCRRIGRHDRLHV
jgi:hypothetical protein